MTATSREHIRGKKLINKRVNYLITDCEAKRSPLSGADSCSASQKILLCPIKPSDSLKSPLQLATRLCSKPKNPSLIIF